MRVVTSVAMVGLLLLLGAPAAYAAGEASSVYSCDFEQDMGGFRPESVGDGASVQPDGSAARSGAQSVRLGDTGPSVEVALGGEWAAWAERPNRASLKWARHWTPEAPLVVRKDHVYEVRAYVKLQDAEAVGIRATVWSSGELPVRGQRERYSPIVSGTRDWGWISARIACTSGDGELADITIALLGRGTAWVDDVHIIEYAQPEPSSINSGVYPPVQVVEVRAETASCIAIEYTGDLDWAAAEEPANWTVTGEGAFADDVRPARTGRIKRLANPDGKLWWRDAYRHTIFLLLPQPMQSGRAYRVVAENVGVERQEFDLLFDERAGPNPNIKANQYGYLPDARKFAYVGGWLGSAGPLPLDDYVGEFQVVDAQTGEAAFRGVPALRMPHDEVEPLSTSSLQNLTGEDVYELDFSALTRGGEYYVLVPGVGRSFPFRIAADVYAEPFYHCARAIMHQRCGMELAEPYSVYARRPCHRSPAAGVDANIVEHGREGQDALVKADPSVLTGVQVDAWGGYHDAADYDRLVGHYRVPATLMQLYEMFPNAFPDGQLNLPESGNGLPDIVDEALWQVDFGVRMQGEKGGVRGGLGPNASVTHTADEDDNPIYAYGPDPVTSLALAGVAAQAARVLGGLEQDERAAGYLAAARRAWDYAVARYGAEFPIAHAFAALELYRATGEAPYLDAFRPHTEAIAGMDALAQSRYEGLFVWNVWLSYLQCDRPGLDAAVRDRFLQCIVSAAEREIANIESYAYRMPSWMSLIGKPVRYGWGTGTNFPGGEFLVMAWWATGEKRYRDHALLAADFALGCHPTGTIYITGLGRRHVQWVMHSMSDPMATLIGAPVAETVPGVPLFSVHGYPLGFSGWQSQLLYVYENPTVGSMNFFPPPKDWPDLRLFADIGWVPILSEHTVGSTMLHTTFLFGALQAAQDRE